MEGADVEHKNAQKRKIRSWLFEDPTSDSYVCAGSLRQFLAKVLHNCSFMRDVRGQLQAQAPVPAEFSGVQSGSRIPASGETVQPHCSEMKLGVCYCGPAGLAKYLKQVLNGMDIGPIDVCMEYQA